MQRASGIPLSAAREGLLAGAGLGGLALWSGADPPIVLTAAVCGWLSYRAARKRNGWTDRIAAGVLALGAPFPGPILLAAALYGFGGRRIPGIKSLLIALAWAGWTVPAPLPVVLFAAFRVFVGSVAGDLADAEDDRRRRLRTLANLHPARTTVAVLIANALSLPAVAFLPEPFRPGAAIGAAWAIGAVLLFRAGRLDARTYGWVVVDLQYVAMGLAALVAGWIR